MYTDFLSFPLSLAVSHWLFVLCCLPFILLYRREIHLTYPYILCTVLRKDVHDFLFLYIVIPTTFFRWYIYSLPDLITLLYRFQNFGNSPENSGQGGTCRIYRPKCSPSTYFIEPKRVAKLASIEFELRM